jgi:hypothetical protein
MYINEMQRISEAKKMSKRKIKILERKTGGSGPSQNHRLHFEEGQGGRGEEGGRICNRKHVLCRHVVKKLLKYLLHGSFIFLYSYVHTMFGSFILPAPHPLPIPLPPLLPGRTCPALSSILLKRRHKQ